MANCHVVRLTESDVGQNMDDLSKKVGSTIIGPIIQEIIDKKGGVGGATRVSEVTVSNDRGNVLVYVGKTRTRSLLDEVKLCWES